MSEQGRLFETPTIGEKIEQRNERLKQIFRLLAPIAAVGIILLLIKLKKVIK